MATSGISDLQGDGLAAGSKRSRVFAVVAVLVLALMAALSGGASLRESVTIDEVAHIGAGVSYLQKFDLRLNEEHPPLPKMLAALPLVLRGVHTDYSHRSWTISRTFFLAYLGQWIFGSRLVTGWNDSASVLAWARMPMLLLTLLLGWTIYSFARRIGGEWAGLACIAAFAGTPVFLAFGPLVLTDIAITLFSLLSLWAFASVWQNPDRKNVRLFALALSGALLSKFTAGILFFIFPAFALSTRWRPLPGQPLAKQEARAWRKLRWRATYRGILWAAAIVYIFYFVFSLGQPTDALDRLGSGLATAPIRRLLMPPWLYLRGIFMVIVTASRSTFLLGRVYPHGVWFYFPVVYVLKTPLGSLALLLLALIVALTFKRHGTAESPLVPAEFAVHWRALWVGLVLFTAFCLFSRLDISIRHFSIPMALLIVLIAPLPRGIAQLARSAPAAAKALACLIAILVLSCLFTAVSAYPYYFPYVNALGTGRPAYTLVSDSNIDWNQSLPEVRSFVEQHGITTVLLDDYSMEDGSSEVPQSQLWNCQQPSASDAGKFAVVSSNMLLDGHNCTWLIPHLQQSLAGGSMYVVQLPDPIPPAGSPKGPPLPAEYHTFLGATYDPRPLFIRLDRHPEQLPDTLAQAQAMMSALSSSPPNSAPASPASGADSPPTR